VFDFHPLATHPIFRHLTGEAIPSNDTVYDDWRRLDVWELNPVQMILSPLERAMAFSVLGTIGAEEIIAIATDAIVLGSDSPSLRELAGTSTGDVDEVPRLLEQTARELGFRQLTKEEALRAVSTDICRQISSGEVRPYDGAKWLWRTVVESEVPHQHELDPFIYAASEFESRPADQEFFENAIRQEARDLLSRRAEER
jgi:hypothetical protein